MASPEVNIMTLLQSLMHALKELTYATTLHHKLICKGSIRHLRHQVNVKFMVIPFIHWDEVEANVPVILIILVQQDVAKLLVHFE